MAETLYELTFYGRLVDGVSLETAKSNVVTLFKASPAQVEKMFAGGRVVIRNKLDQATVTKYVAVMRKNGLVCETEVMGASAPETVSPAPTAAKPREEVAPAKSSAALQVVAPPAAAFTAKPLSQGNSATTGRLNVAGENVDELLQQSDLVLDPVGIRLSEHEEVEAPVFSELDRLSIAPVGTVLAEAKETVPPIVPDTSGISIAPVGSDMGQIKHEESVDVPDLSHLQLDDAPGNQ